MHSYTQLCDAVIYLRVRHRRSSVFGDLRAARYILGNYDPVSLAFSGGFRISRTFCPVVSDTETAGFTGLKPPVSDMAETAGFSLKPPVAGSSVVSRQSACHQWQSLNSARRWRFVGVGGPRRLSKSVDRPGGDLGLRGSNPQIRSQKSNGHTYGAWSG